MSVDVFGRCGKPCPDKDDNGIKGGCKQIISKKYKFYLSYENSFCKDYHSEKLFDILEYNIIPVVFNLASTEKYVIF